MAATSHLDTSTDPARVAWVDHAKGICIILVVMMHSTLGLGEAIGREGWMHHVVAFSRPFRMPDFFLVSGLFLARSIDKPWGHYLDRKVVHFAYFYFLWAAIQIALRAPSLAQGSVLNLVREAALAIIDPFGTLWFIYLLAVFFVVTRLLKAVPIPILIGVAAALEIAHLHSDWMVPHEFGRRWIYFLIGYAFAREIFAFAGAAGERPRVALLGLLVWALANGTLVKLGLADLPFVSLALGLAGALAVAAVAALLARLPLANGLRYIGQRSIVIYLAFFLPMAATRILLVKLGLAGLDVGTASLVIITVAVMIPLMLGHVVRGTMLSFLFERPRWARLASRPEAARRAAETPEPDLWRGIEPRRGGAP